MHHFDAEVGAPPFLKKKKTEVNLVCQTETREGLLFLVFQGVAALGLFFSWFVVMVFARFSIN
jgi:hypothetical protein